MDVLRISERGLIEDFVLSALDKSVAYIDAGLLPAASDYAFNVSRQVSSRQSEEYPDLIQLKVHGKGRSLNATIEEKVVGAVRAIGGVVTASRINQLDPMGEYTIGQIRGALARCVEAGTLAKGRVHTSAGGGRPADGYVLA